MRKSIIAFLALGAMLVTSVFAHDPRTVAKDFSHSLAIDGAGKLMVSYKSLHWNQPAYENAKKNEQLRTRLNAGLWKKIGKFDSEFDTEIGGIKVPKGSYSLGLNFDANDNFKLVLGGASEINIPLKTAMDAPDVTHLTFDIRPTEQPDTFLIEGRSGKIRAFAEIKVPYLAQHEHKGEHKN